MECIENKNTFADLMNNLMPLLNFENMEQLLEFLTLLLKKLKSFKLQINNEKLYSLLI